MIIVNADDFGYSTRINDAIIECFQRGWITSATIMANMPAFEQACRLAQQFRFENRIGIHINVTEGVPLTDRMRASQTFCDDDGHFVHRRHLRLDRRDRAWLAGEVDAQIDRCRAYGLPLTHADSHQHAHIDPAVFTTIVPLLRSRGIPWIRIPRNTDDACRTQLPKQLYKSCLSMVLDWYGLRRTDYFGDLSGLERLQSRCSARQQSIEAMVHPTIATDGTIIDRLDGSRLADRLSSIRNRDDHSASPTLPRRSA